MKKVILGLFLLIGINQVSNAQFQFGLKGGINYNSNSIKETSQDVFDGANSKTGYHIGVWTRLKIPIIPVSFDYENKKVVIHPNFIPSEDEKKDIQSLEKVFKGVKGYSSEKSF